ncbi:hypothetical protein ABZY68_19340 [Streptomyces sp. NPDC006482]|uniref:hypothetical protein n=1 Tax=Streptomyces sp. NPDC006482 TaxID=3154306 RepID=UPI0033AC5724
MRGVRARRVLARRALAGVALAGVLLGASGCASAVDPIERLGRKAVERGRGPGEATTVADRAARLLREAVREEARAPEHRDRHRG